MPVDVRIEAVDFAGLAYRRYSLEGNTGLIIRCIVPFGLQVDRKIDRTDFDLGPGLEILDPGFKLSLNIPKVGLWSQSDLIAWYLLLIQLTQAWLFVALTFQDVTTCFVGEYFVKQERVVYDT